MPAGIGDEHGDSLSEASPISLGSETGGKLSAGDEDYFVIEMTHAGTLVAYTTGDTDTYGSILNSSGSVLTSNDEAGPGSNFRVSASVSPGTYYIRVRGYGSLTSGSYTLYADGQNQIRLTDHGWAGSPFWSPDGSRLAFVSDREGNSEIYVMDANIGESIGDVEDLIRYNARYNAVIYYDAMTLINTLVSSFRDALAIALVSDEVDLPEAGGGTLKIAGNTWTLQDYSPGGPLVLTDTFGWLEINGTLEVAKDQFPTVPVVGTVETSSPSSIVTLDIVVDASGAELSMTGTVTIEDVDFDIAEILAAAEFGFLLLFE